MVTRHLNCVQVANNCLILLIFFIQDTTFVFFLNTGPGMLIKSLTLCVLMDFIYLRPPDKSVYLKIILLCLNQNMHCGYSKEPSQ